LEFEAEMLERLSLEWLGLFVEIIGVELSLKALEQMKKLGRVLVYGTLKNGQN
jgi:hypothetical protein